MRMSLVAALLLVTACTASSEDRLGTETSNQTEGRRLQTIKGREWARCWFEQDLQNAKLQCTSTARGTDPLPAKVEVLAFSVQRDQPDYAKVLDIEAGSTVTAFSIPRSAFPVTLFFHAKLGADAAAMIGVRGSFGIELRPELRTPDELSARQPAVLAQPFDLWPVAFIDARSGNMPPGAFQVDAQPYTRSIEPYADSGEYELSIQKSIIGEDVHGKLTYFVAPKTTGPIALTIDTFSDTPAREVMLSGPGYYAINDDASMTPASPALVARDFP